MLYEDPNEDPQSEKRFHIELHFSPGAKGNQTEGDFPQGGGYRTSSRPASRAVRATSLFTLRRCHVLM